MLALHGRLAGVIDDVTGAATSTAQEELLGQVPRTYRPIVSEALANDKVGVVQEGLAIGGLPRDFVGSDGKPNKYRIVVWGLAQAGLPSTFVNPNLTPNYRAIIAWAVRRIELRSAVAPTFSFGIEADAPPPEPKPEKPGAKIDIRGVMGFVKPEVRVTTAAGVVDVAPFGKSALGEGEAFFAMWKRRLLLAAAALAGTVGAGAYGVYRVGKWRGRGS